MVTNANTTTIPDELTSTQPQPNVKRRGRPKGTEQAKMQQNVAKVIRNNPGISTRELAVKAEISPTTAQAYLAKWGINKQDIDMFVENRVDIVRSKQQQILDALTPDKLEKAAARDLMVGYGILLDKDRLESGQSTANVASWTHVVQQSQHVQVVDNKE